MSRSAEGWSPAGAVVLAPVLHVVVRAGARPVVVVVLRLKELVADLVRAVAQKRLALAASISQRGGQRVALVIETAHRLAETTLVVTAAVLFAILVKEPCLAGKSLPALSAHELDATVRVATQIVDEVHLDHFLSTTIEE